MIWRTYHRSRAALFGSALVLKSRCECSAPTGEVVAATLHEHARIPCGRVWTIRAKVAHTEFANTIYPQSPPLAASLFHEDFVVPYSCRSHFPMLYWSPACTKPTRLPPSAEWALCEYLFTCVLRPRSIPRSLCPRQVRTLATTGATRSARSVHGLPSLRLRPVANPDDTGWESGSSDA